MLAFNLAPSWLFMCCNQLLTLTLCYAMLLTCVHVETLTLCYDVLRYEISVVEKIKCVTRLCACCLTLTLCYAMLLTCVHIILMLLDPGQPFWHIYTMTIINVSRSVTQALPNVICPAQHSLIAFRDLPQLHPMFDKFRKCILLEGSGAAALELFWAFLSHTCYPMNLSACK